jgi:transcriptional regulator with XRE-family HTH domain
MDAHLGKFIKEQRKLRKITQAQVAEALGVRQGTIARWESGQRHMAEKHIRALALLMSLPAEQLRAQWRPSRVGRRPSTLRRGQTSYLEVTRPVVGSIPEMLQMSDVIEGAYQQAWRLLPTEQVHYEMARNYPRDSVLELAGAYQLLAWGCDLEWLAPLRANCDLPIIFPGTQRYAGDFKRHTLVLRDNNIEVLFFPQVTVAVLSQSRERRLDLLVKYTRDGRSVYADVEFDGVQHRQQMEEDTRRMWGMGLRRLGYNRAAVCNPDFVERLLADLHKLWLEAAEAA